LHTVVGLPHVGQAGGKRRGAGIVTDLPGR